jgi:hypothetical protein
MCYSVPQKGSAGEYEVNDRKVSPLGHKKTALSVLNGERGRASFFFFHLLAIVLAIVIDEACVYDRFYVLPRYG